MYSTSQHPNACTKSREKDIWKIAETEKSHQGDMGPIQHTEKSHIK